MINIGTYQVEENQQDVCTDESTREEFQDCAIEHGG